MTLLALAVSGRGVVDPDEPVVHADDEGFLRGRGAFETVRVYAGRPFRLDAHLTRLERSAERLGLALPPRKELEHLTEDVLDATDEVNAALRIYVTPGREGQGQGLALAMAATLPAELDQLRERGLRVVSVRLPLQPPDPLGGTKSTSYALNMVAQQEARAAGADDAVFLSAAGTVLEAPTSNVWWRRGRALFTPSLDLGILAGVTREFVLEAAPRLGYGVGEGHHAVADLTGADEAFLTSSIREVMPVAEVDGTELELGPAARDLQAALREAATPPGDGRRRRT